MGGIQKQILICGFSVQGKTADAVFPTIFQKMRSAHLLGRKNWLFNDTPKGAQASAVVYTMMEMAKAHNLNICKYLNYLLEQLPDTKMTDEELSRLVPWNEDIIACCSGAM